MAVHESQALWYFVLVLGALILPVALYRLYIHPLSKFPGPPVAAITGVYELYYDLIVSGGMLECIERLHRVYGPVVRTGPNQLHFSEPSAYFDIYAQGSNVTKDPRLYAAFTLEGSIVTLIDPAKSRSRREMMHPFFSRRAVLNLENVIQTKVDKLITNLRLFSSNGKPMDMHLAFRSATHDIITSYCFSQCFDILDDPNFDDPIMTAVMAQMPAVWILKHFHWLTRLPSRQILRWNRGFQSIMHIRDTLAKQIDEYLMDNARLVSSEHETIYHHLITPSSKQSSRHEALSRADLIDEAITLLNAGSDTVGQTSTSAVFYVLADPKIHRRLLDELKNAWPDKDQNVSLAVLEKLPYLTAVIKETMRMSTGIITPLPRVVASPNMNIGGYSIPHGTVVAMGHTFLHNNPTIFPDPREFKPERWLERKDLDAYLVPFSRGPRMCLGTNLAWAELYMIIGNTLRRLDLKVHNTTAHDMDDYREFFAPFYRRHFHAFVSDRKE